VENRVVCIPFLKIDMAKKKKKDTEPIKEYCHMCHKLSEPYFVYDHSKNAVCSLECKEKYFKQPPLIK